MIRRLIVFLFSLVVPGVSQAIVVGDYPYLEAMIDRLVAEHGLDRTDLVKTFEKVQLRPEVVEAMKRPAESLPWYRYRPIFVNPTHISNGVRFWGAHRQVLARAASESGVPPEIIVAVIGIETRYGATLGSHPVLESLTTLTLQYPRRREFFGEQLEQFLLLTHEQSLDRLSILGSYAGAIGIPQFMPSSYRRYAVDYTGDGRVDLVNQTDDAIGSVANYLKRANWQRGEPVSVEVRNGDKPDDSLIDVGRRPNTTVGALRASGISLDPALADDTRAGVVALDDGAATSYRVVFDNFYAIMRYNPSVLYAMAVHDLGAALKREYRGS